MKITGKVIWRIFAIIILVSWIPLNIWFGRHDSNLLSAVISNDLLAAKKAVHDGADVNMSIKRNFTLLQVAAMNHDNVEMAKFLIESGIEPDALNDDGDSASSIAARSGHKDMAEFLSLSTIRNPKN